MFAISPSLIIVRFTHTSLTTPQMCYAGLHRGGGKVMAGEGGGERAAGGEGRRGGWGGGVGGG